nr:retrovirus-related Pol polyprotein from transposon TNT 1-94 [Tanacetum cinerariifolium]
KFEGKADEGFLVGYYVNSKAFRVFNSRTRKVEENLHIKFLENKPNVTRRGPEWLFDIDSLTISMNYEPVTAGNQTNDDVGKGDEGVSKGSKIDDQERTDSITLDVNTSGLSINIANININIGSLSINTVGYNDPSMPSLEETGIFDDVYNDREVGAEDGTNNLELSTVDERGIVVRYKARLVAQGYTQEEGIYYDEVFAPVARIKAIRLFLAYASFMGFIVYQMDVKSAFLYGTIEEEVYVCQPPGFEDPHFPNKKSLCDEFEQIMHKRFQMSSMRELTFFLGLQTTITPIEPIKALIKDAVAKDVNNAWYYQLKVNAARYILTTAGMVTVLGIFYINRTIDSIKVILMIYTSCIKQFWTSAKVKTVNEDIRLQALVDGKNVNET